MIDNVLYTHIFTTVTQTGGFVYGSAEGLKPPYIIMNKVSDPEESTRLCETQGEIGEAIFQFSAYSGGATATNPMAHVQYLQAFKEQIKNILGTIGTTETFIIESNRTTGVRLMSDGANSGNVWGAMFETTVKWRKG